MRTHQTLVAEIDNEYRRVCVNNVVVRDSLAYAHDVGLDNERQNRAALIALDKAYRALIETVMSITENAARNQE